MKRSIITSMILGSFILGSSAFAGNQTGDGFACRRSENAVNTKDLNAGKGRDLSNEKVENTEVQKDEDTSASEPRRPFHHFGHSEQ